MTDRLVDRFSSFLLLLAGCCAAPPRDEHDLVQLRERLVRSLDDAVEEAAEHAGGDPQMPRLVRLARPLLLYGADGIVCAASGALAGRWHRLEQEFMKSARGGDDFFDRLEHDREYADPQLQELALSLLVLGFRGRYATDPDRLEEVRETLASRIDGGAKPERRLAARAYESVVATAPPELPVVRWIRFATLSIGGLLLLAVIGNAISACTLRDPQTKVEDELKKPPASAAVRGD
jgi:type IV/VI secretion system ImpK/VasF family protein